MQIFFNKRVWFRSEPCIAVHVSSTGQSLKWKCNLVAKKIQGSVFSINWKPHAKVQVLLAKKISPIFSTWLSHSIYFVAIERFHTGWCFHYLNCCRDSSFSLFLFFKMDMNRCFSVHMNMNGRLAALCCHHLYAGIHNLTNIVTITKLMNYVWMISAKVEFHAQETIWISEQLCNPMDFLSCISNVLKQEKQRTQKDVHL